MKVAISAGSNENPGSNPLIFNSTLFPGAEYTHDFGEAENVAGWRRSALLSII